MFKNRIISLAMTTLLSVNSFQDASPIFYGSIVADVNAGV